MYVANSRDLRASEKALLKPIIVATEDHSGIKEEIELNVHITHPFTTHQCCKYRTEFHFTRIL